jgi:uncharacterized protein YndB with AHSA1/START domain
MASAIMLLKTIAILAVLIAAILLFAATKPDTFRIQRSLIIQAPPEKIFPLINDLHQWPQWAPQDKEDPSMKRAYGGAESGLGAISDWSGSGSTGRGRMIITESVPPKRITLQVDWVKPFTARNLNQFTLEPDGTSTRVSWSMEGPNLYAMKLMSIFTNMDHLMGQHFETGLANLKLLSER